MSMPRSVAWSLAPLLLSLGLPALAGTCALQPDLAQATRTAFEQVQAGLDGQDEEAVALGRARWKTYKEAGYALTYWQQTETGGWEQKA